MSDPARLRSRAESLAAPLPALLADARHLAQTVLLGSHGRRRPGQGDEFWQYRGVQPGDEARAIDWRRSGRSDGHFVRQREWQAAQSVMFWVDRSHSMDYTSGDHATKDVRAAEIALAAAILLNHGGERVGLSDHDLPPRTGSLQLLRMGQALESGAPAADYGAPVAREMPSRSRAVFLSDFLGDIAPVERALLEAADRGVSGVLLHILDPAEEAFPFDGRTIFESMGGTLRHETLKAGDLRGRYLDRLAERKARLAHLARTTGWQYHLHHSDGSASAALLWLYGALERGS